MQDRTEKRTKAPEPYTPALLAVALFIHSGFLNFQRRSSDILTMGSSVCLYPAPRCFIRVMDGWCRSLSDRVGFFEVSKALRMRWRVRELTLRHSRAVELWISLRGRSDDAAGANEITCSIHCKSHLPPKEFGRFRTSSFEMKDAFIVFSSNPYYYYQSCYTPQPVEINASLLPPSCTYTVSCAGISHPSSNETHSIYKTASQHGTAASTSIESKRRKKPEHDGPFALLVQTKLSIPASRDSCMLQEGKIQLRWPCG
jgi:hypothetical protein